MTSPLGDGNVNDGGNQSGGGDGNNPAWGSILNIVPEDYHQQLIPELRNWDSGVQNRFNQIHSQYEPYKQFIDNKIAPDTLNTAVNFVNALEANPSEVINALQGYYGLTPQQAANVVSQQQNQQLNSNNDDLGPMDPRIEAEFRRLSQQNETMAQILIQQRDAELQKQEDTKLEQHLSKLHTDYSKKHGFDFDEQFVLAIAQNGVSLEKAVDEFYTRAANIAKNYVRPAPNVISGGGGVPNSNINTRNMGQQDLNSYVTQLLQRANNEN